MEPMILESDFKQVERLVYSKCNFKYTIPIRENESPEYGAGTFKLNNLFIKLRSSKVTPKKVGQFVTLWKRNNEGVTQPHSLSDSIDLVVINTRKDDLFGQFIFPAKILERHGILSSDKSKGKRGFRIYPPWDKTTNTQATKTQKWQLEFFLEINEQPDLTLAKSLYLGS
jgi:hypothetical protein